MPTASTTGRRALAIAAAAAAATLAACSRSSEPLTLRVAAVRQPATSLFYVAQAAGCFTRERLTVQERSFELGRDAIATLGGGSDVAVAYTSVVVRAAAARPDEELRVIGTLHHSTRNTRLVTTVGSGVTTFADLQGKRLGLARRTNAEFFGALVLRFAGVERSSVAIVDLATDALVEQLVAGSIDAAVLSDPHADDAERRLGGRARVLESDLYDEYSLLATPGGLVEQRAPALRALLRGLLCGERFAREHPAETMAELRRRFPELTEAVLREQLGRVTWGVQLDNLLLESLRTESEWFLGAPSRAAQRLVDARLLEQADPEHVLLLPDGRVSP